MSIDKALNQAHLGLDSLVPNEFGGPEIEIEVENPESMSIGIDGMEIDLEPAQEGPEDFNANLAEEMDPNAMGVFANDLATDIDNDKNSRKDWEKAYTQGLKLLGLQYEERTEPWNGASGVFHPMITEAVVRFQSETITEMFPAQ